MSALRSVAKCALLLGVVVLSPTRAHAQQRAAITPFFTSFFAPLPYGKDIDQGGGVTADERMTTAPGVGLRVGVPFGATLGVEAEATYIWSGRQAKVTGNGATVGFFLTGNAAIFSGRLTYRPRRSNFRLIVGGAVETLGGDAWKSAFTGPSAKSTSVGGILGFGAKANITPHLGLDVTVTSFLHSSDPAGFDKKQFQADVMLGVGVPIGLGK